MRVTISTPVKQSLPSVARGFDQSLFKKLSPPFPSVRLIRFEGSEKGNVVTLELDFIIFKQIWESHIIENGETACEWYFVDIGKKLPFFLQYWQHRHRVVQTGTHATIIDDITFETPFFLTDFLLYPVMWLQFWYRKPIYKRVFC